MRNGAVAIDELVRGVNIALGSLSFDGCLPIDRNGDGALTIDELIAAVSNALSACLLSTSSPAR